jgi:hypothetical protein
MAYDDMTFRRQAGEPDGGDPGAYRTGPAAADHRTHRRDDEGRDRLGVHLGWEIVLLLAVAAIGYLLHRLDPAGLRRPALDTLLVSGAMIGLLTLGAGLTLRAGVPNLALGPIALASALQYAENGDLGVVRSTAPALIIAAAGGLAVAVLIVALHVPGWAATLAAGMGVIVYDQLRTAPVPVQGDYDPSAQAFYLFGGFALLAVIGAAIGTLAPVRRWLGRRRPAGDPADRRGATAALPVILTLVLSSLFAVVAGVLMAAQSTTPIVPGTGLEWTGIALGTALVAGTSAFGRRGGVFGTLLAVAGMALFLDYADRRKFDIALFAIAACTIGGGLLITRLVETYGRPLPVSDLDGDWTTAGGNGAGGWSSDLPDSWTPAASVQNRPERWDDGPWGSTR